jgi:ubiquinone/menaquinone biosynthesis C-methylase UbiE
MANSTANFYDALAEHYHLIFDDWEQAIRRQASVLNPLLTAQLGGGKLRILDCACGIGTQAIGFAQKGQGSWRLTSARRQLRAPGAKQHSADWTLSFMLRTW